MTSTGVGDTVRELIARQIGLDQAGLADGDRLQEDLGLDSTDAAELLVTVNEEHGLVIDLDELEQASTVGDLVALFRAAEETGG